MSRIWIDVEDLFRYAASSPRPSGIQRLAYEVEREIVALRGKGDCVRFLRHAPTRDSFAEIPWQNVVALYDSLVAKGATRAAPRPPARPNGPPQRGLLRRGLSRLSRFLPAAVREPLAQSVRLQVAFLRTLKRAAKTQIAAWKALTPAVKALVGAPTGPAYAALPPDGAARFAAAVRPGDMLLVLGAPWWHPDHAALVRKARTRHGMRFGLLIYDLIPVLHPEWCDRSLVRHFIDWLDGVLGQADLLLAISQATAHDVQAHARTKGMALAGPVVPIPIGTGFGPPCAETPAALVSANLPAPGSYVLFVSTIEARKNHALLFRVWQRLLAEMPPGSVPKLVFAGRVGWLVADLMAQLENTGWLDGHVVLVEDPPDADLTALYQGCLFTLFPSFYEGWGLPVTESLAFGKPCVIASDSSLPEAGNGLARFFDPDDLSGATRTIRETLEDRPGLAAWEERIQREFRPVSWSAAAEAVLAACERAERNGSSPQI